MYDYQSNYQADTVSRYQSLYEKFVGIYHALLLAQDEGVFEITVRSQTGVVAVPVSFGDGTEIAAMMVENFSKRVDRMQHQLNDQLAEAGSEFERSQQKAAKARAANEAEAAQARAAMSAHQTPAGQLAIARELVAQAAATPPQQPAPRKAGRPRKEVAEALGQAAVAVPMNGSRPGPSGQVTNLPH